MWFLVMYYQVIPGGGKRMSERQRVAMTISLPPATAKEYRKIAKLKGASGSQLFREMFDQYKRQKLRDELSALQVYGSKKAKTLNITEKEIEKLVFEDR
jgi:hypothetical protein